MNETQFLRLPCSRHSQHAGWGMIADVLHTMFFLARFARIDTVGGLRFKSARAYQFFQLVTPYNHVLCCSKTLQLNLFSPSFPALKANLQLPENTERVRCMYCGGEVIVAEAMQKFKASIDLKNIFELAQAAEQSANYDESYSYYTKILEVNLRVIELGMERQLQQGGYLRWQICDLQKS
jgi:hypothetical protein